MMSLASSSHALKTWKGNVIPLVRNIAQVVVASRASLRKWLVLALLKCSDDMFSCVLIIGFIA
jgi:hypothetical protein